MYWTWVIYYIGSDGKEIVSAGHSESQSAEDFTEQVQKGRVIANDLTHLIHPEGEHLHIKIARGESINVNIDLHLWKHENSSDTQIVKNTFKSTHIEYLEMLAQSRIEAKQSAANKFASSLSSITSSISKAIPDPRIAAGVAVSSDAINLFRNTIHYIRSAIKDKLIQQRSITAKISRGWDGAFTLSDVKIVGEATLLPIAAGVVQPIVLEFKGNDTIVLAHCSVVLV